VDGIAVEATGTAEQFGAAVKTVLDIAAIPLILIAEDAEVMAAGVKAADGVKPLIYGATSENWQAFAELAKGAGAPMAVKEEYFDALVAATKAIKEAGVDDIVIDHGARDWTVALAKQTQLRRMALKKNVREVGYPIIAFPDECVEDPSLGAMAAAQAITKYAGFVVLDEFKPEAIYPLLALRESIYTDPQTPIQVQPGLYEIGEPTDQSPLFITTNFSITYFSVANEVSSSGIPGWLLVADAEGMSVLTAWAAGKFDAERIAKSVRGTGVAEKLAHRKLVIPGHVSVLLGEIEEELPEWKILVGPREAVDLPRYLKVWETL
jgi:acetyl-CoA decarbonylase/synthase, CODH/ACS complex subunit gamma